MSVFFGKNNFSFFVLGKRSFCWWSMVWRFCVECSWRWKSRQYPWRTT